MITLAVISLVCALMPCALFICNLRAYVVPKAADKQPLPAVSVLIPARNEEQNIEGALQSVLANTGIEYEVIVLDDHSNDRTPEMVKTFARSDPRVRLEQAPPLPPGWCGKQHACSALARLARHPILLFMDADVRLTPDALSRCVAFLQSSNSALISGVPRQVLGTFWEEMLLPLIHFVLLGFLPIQRMRRGTDPAYSAGCGQLFIARAEAYAAAGGHAGIRKSLHDGIKLPRLFRAAGFRTDLFDATLVAKCRMYSRAREVFSGLSKNATEGLGAPARIVPITLLFFFGQVLPLLLLLLLGLPAAARAIAGMAFAAALLPRLLATTRFKQPLWSALAHPFGIAVLLGIQWFAFLRGMLGRPAQWRGRAYAGGTAAVLLFTSLALPGATTEGMMRIKSFTLTDQHERKREFNFPRTNVTFVVVADWKGSEQLEGWIKPIHDRYTGRIAIEGVADVSAVPPGLRGTVRRAFAKKLNYAVMLDWSGGVANQFAPAQSVANVFVIARDGRVLLRLGGEVNEDKLTRLRAVLDREL